MLIRLNNRDGNTSMLVDVNSIVAIRDLRTDKVVAGLKDFQWTTIFLSSGHSFDVMETESEILKKMA